MAIFSHFGSRDLAWCGEQGIGFGSSLDGAGLNAAQAITDTLLGNEHQQFLELRGLASARCLMMIPGQAQLHGMFEAELAWQPVGQKRCLRHDQSNEIVGQQVDPDFLDRHCRALATQPLHAQGGLDVAQIQFSTCQRLR